MPRTRRGPRSTSDSRPLAEPKRRSDTTDELLSAMSHDLRSPLGSLLVWLELLRGQDLDPATARVAAKIEAGVREVRDMVVRFLDMAQILSGTLALEMDAADPSAAVEAALGAVRTQAEIRGVHLSSAVDRSLPPLRADSRSLRHALECLVANAVETTPSGGSVEVRVEGTADGILFRVRDSGPGLGSDDLASLCEGLAAGIVPDGGGLRLAVALGVARLHGGRVHAASEGEGRGVVFALELPLAPAPAVPGARTR